MAVCRKCGKVLKDDEMFCSACGTSVKAAPSENIPETEEVSEVVTTAVSAEKATDTNGSDSQSAPSDGKKKRKGWIIAACVLAGLAAIGTVLFFIFRKSETEKIVSAFQKTLTAESFACEGSASYGKYEYEFNGEIAGGKSGNMIYGSLTWREGSREYREEIAFAGGTVYGKSLNYYDEDWYYWDEDSKTAADVLNKLCEKDYFGAVKSHRGFEEDVKEICRNYEEIPEILKQMLDDCVKSSDEVDFIRSVKKKDNKYTLVVNPKQLLKAAKKEYGLKIDNDFYAELLEELESNDIGDAEVSFVIEKGYVTSITAEVEVGSKTAEASVKFKDFDKIDTQKKEVDDLKESVESRVVRQKDLYALEDVLSYAEKVACSVEYDLMPGDVLSVTISGGNVEMNVESQSNGGKDALRDWKSVFDDPVKLQSSEFASMQNGTILGTVTEYWDVEWVAYGIPETVTNQLRRVRQGGSILPTPTPSPTPLPTNTPTETPTPTPEPTETPTPTPTIAVSEDNIFLKTDFESYAIGSAVNESEYAVTIQNNPYLAYLLFQSIGSAYSDTAQSGGKDGTIGLVCTGRSSNWNGIALNIDPKYYGKGFKISFDARVKSNTWDDVDEMHISLTTKFQAKNDAGKVVMMYPRYNRVEVTSVNGDWVHGEGIVYFPTDIVYDPENAGTIAQMYFECADGTGYEDIYFDNIEIYVIDGIGDREAFDAYWEANNPETQLPTPTPIPIATPTPTPTAAIADNERITLTMWCIAVDDNYLNDVYKKAIAELSEVFPNVTLDWITEEPDWYSLKLKTATETDALPDIFFTRSFTLGNSVQSGRVYCLDDAYKKYAGSLSEKMCRNTTYNGKKYGIPLSMSTAYMFVNMDVLKKVGYSTVPSTFDELTDCCEALLAAGYTPFGIAGGMPWCVSEYLESIIIKLCGADKLNSILRGEADWYDQGVAESVNLLQDMIAKGYFGKGFENKYDYSDVCDDLAAGRCAFYVNGSWNSRQLSNSGANIKVSEFPVINADKSKLGQLVGGPSDTLAVSASSKHAGLAAQYAYELAKRISKYAYLEENSLPSWKIDYDDSKVNSLFREAAKMATNADYLVLYGDNLLSSDEVSTYYQKLQDLISSRGYTGMQFVNEMNRAEFSDTPIDQNALKKYIQSKLQDRDFKGRTFVIGDWWSSDDSSDQLDSTVKKRFEDCNGSIVRKAVYGWYDSFEMTLLSLTDNHPLADVFVMDYRMIGYFTINDMGMFADLSQLGCIGFEDDKWNNSVKKAMKIGNAVYGITDEKNSGVGFLYNKKLMKELYGDADYPYTLQAQGKWNWDAFESLVGKLTVDRDGNGTTDVYGFAGQMDLFFSSVLASNGHAIVSKGSNGKFVNNAEDPKVLNDLNWAYSLIAKGYVGQRGENDPWDYYKDQFRNQKTVFVLGFDWDARDYLDADFEMGFVGFPYGSNLGKNISIRSESVELYMIPNVPATKDYLEDIAYALKLYTDPVESGAANDWKSSYVYAYAFSDGKALDETVNRMFNEWEDYCDPSYVINGLWEMGSSPGALRQFFYDCYSSDKTMEEQLKELSKVIQPLIDRYNKYYAS